jgi:D-alanine--poly(phosphoribitol) ligase subunit 2
LAAHAIDPVSARNDVRAKIVELASRTTLQKPVLRDDEVIPETGLLDSAASQELVDWLETRFGVVIDQRDLTTENFGTVNAIVNYLGEHARPMA